MLSVNIAAKNTMQIYDKDMQGHGHEQYTVDPCRKVNDKLANTNVSVTSGMINAAQWKEQIHQRCPNPTGVFDLEPSIRVITKLYLERSRTNLTLGMARIYKEGYAEKADTG